MVCYHNVIWYDHTQYYKEYLIQKHQVGMVVSPVILNMTNRQEVQTPWYIRSGVQIYFVLAKYTHVISIHLTLCCHFINLENFNFIIIIIIIITLVIIIVPIVVTAVIITIKTTTSESLSPSSFLLLLTFIVILLLLVFFLSLLSWYH